jgi:hypothetical protein
MPRFEPVVCRQARRAALAPVAPLFAHVRAEGSSWKCGTNLGPRSREARHGSAGRANGKEPDATWR